MATTSQSNEMISTPQDSQELHDQKSRNNNSIQNSHVDLTTPQQNFSSGQQRISKNSGTISAGEHNGLIITKADTTYIGLGVPTINPTINFGLPTAAIPNRPTALHIYDDIDCRFTNMRFGGRVYQGNSPLATVAHTGTVIFQNCIFEEPIIIAGKAHFIGCTFQPTGSGQIAVANNSGVAANVYIIGCSRLNGSLYGGAGVTVIAETT
jgi:hypothetical protein